MSKIPHRGHGHDHEGAVRPHTHLTSVGIDIGSSTSHLMLSQLLIGYPSLHQRRPVVLERRIIGRSPILITPFTVDRNIEAAPIRELVEGTFRGLGLTREQIDTGAVIITGEAARRDNAQKIAELFADETGRFVCATAGPQLEAIMAAHGSGAIAKSREEGLRLLNIDIGGGTTKISLIVDGMICGKTAINLGARLMAFDAAGSLTRLERGGRSFLGDLSYILDLGAEIPLDLRRRLARRMAELLLDAIMGAPPPWEDFYITTPLGALPKLDGILFSGGVSEYIYGREGQAFGDLGPYLGREVKREAEARGFTILEASDGIRATVIGASQFTVQLSGETIFVPEGAKLPVRNLRVFVCTVDWEPPVAIRSEAAVRKTLGERDPEVCGSPFAIFFSTPSFLGYGAVQELAKGIDRAIVALPAADRPTALVFPQNMGRIIGSALSPCWNLTCIDEVSLSAFDFIDIGAVVEGEGFVPVVVKSLAFGA